MEKMRDSIDFKNMDIAALFRKLLLPTVLGMIFSALFVITDGIFVGKGIGSDAFSFERRRKIGEIKAEVDE